MLRYVFHSPIIFAMLLLVGINSSAQENKSVPAATSNRTTAQSDWVAANEAGAVATLRDLHSAEATFLSTTGNGRYGTLKELMGAGLIARHFTKAKRNGYRFSLSVRPSSHSSFTAWAKPIRYGETGRRTFSIDDTGVVNFSEELNAIAAMMQPLIDEGLDIAGNEASAIASLRTLFSAEATFQATAGHDNFGNLKELADQNLVDLILARGRKNGYEFKITREKSSPEAPSSFEAVAVPLKYGETGQRSFFVDESGVIRVSDRKGMAASSHDEPLGK